MPVRIAASKVKKAVQLKKRLSKPTKFLNKQRNIAKPERLQFLKTLKSKNLGKEGM